MTYFTIGLDDGLVPYMRHPVAISLRKPLCFIVDFWLEPLLRKVYVVYMETCKWQSPVNFPHKGQCRGASMFSLICALNKRLSKQSLGWLFETPSRSLWRHCNVYAGLSSPAVVRDPPSGRNGFVAVGPSEGQETGWFFCIVAWYNQKSALVTICVFSRP